MILHLVYRDYETEFMEWDPLTCLTLALYFFCWWVEHPDPKNQQTETVQTFVVLSFHSGKLLTLN